MEEAHITAAKIWAFLLLAIKISSLGLVIIAPKNNKITTIHLYPPFRRL
jgi:hypothetical protein